MHEYTDDRAEVRTDRCHRPPRSLGRRATGQHLSPGGGTTPFTRYASTVPSTHELCRMYAVCPSPLLVMRCPFWSSAARPCAHLYGVAGSRVVPTTTIGPLPAAVIFLGAFLAWSTVP